MIKNTSSKLSSISFALSIAAFALGCEKTTDHTPNESSGGTSQGGTLGKGGSGGENENSGGLAGNGGLGGASEASTTSNAGSGGTLGTTSTLGTVATVDLRTSGNFAILAESGISSVPDSSITGDVGISPAAATFITGFSLMKESANAFSTSTQVKGKLYSPDYAAPTPEKLTTANGDMKLAFADAAGRAPNVTELGAGSIGGMTLTPGVYKWSTGLMVPTDVTLKGDASAVWVFQVAQNLTVSNATAIVLSGGANAKNVFWQVAGAVELGTTTKFVGIVLSKTSVTMGTGASITGRLLAQTAVNLDKSIVVEPAL
jgi:Ice-binding-like